MATKDEIINLALTRLGVRTITPTEIAEQSNEAARRTTAVWNLVRQSVLRDHDWGFASKTVTLVPDDGNVLGWMYTYIYPTDCLCARALTNGSTPQPFEKLLSSDHIAIACNVPDALLRYTTDVEDTALWDAVYVDAFAWRLAAELAKSLAGDDDKVSGMMQAYMMTISHAGAADAREGRRPEQPAGLGNPYYEVR